MLDEASVKAIASGLTVAAQTAARAEASTRASASGAALDGRRVELDTLIEKHQRFAQQRATRTRDGVEEKSGLVLAYYSKGKQSTEASSAAWARLANEDAFLQAVLQHSQLEIDAARQRLQLAEIETLRTNLSFLEADIVLMAVQHAEAVKPLLATDPSLEEIPYGPRIVEALDLIAHMTVELSKKEKVN